MKVLRSVPLVLVALVAGATSVVAGGASAQAAPTTCQGRPVTIVATTTVTSGTEGDDVVAMEPGAWNRFDAKGGNDTICLAAPAPVAIDRYATMPVGFLDAGAGDDVVLNLTPAGTTGIRTTVVLGIGSDTFQGADVGEEVFAEAYVSDMASLGTDASLAGSQRDVVSGAATVWSSAPVNGLNEDRITFGTGSVRAVLDGRMSPAGLVDLSAASEAAIELPVPSRMRRIDYGFVTVDNQARQVEASGVALTWIGDVDTFLIGYQTSGLDPAPVSFTGSDADEQVTFADVQVAHVSMGGGDDSMTVSALNHSIVPLSADGGPGRDSAYLSAVCSRAFSVKLDRIAVCDGTSGPFTGFRDVAIDGGRTTTLIGTDRGERLVASGDTVVVKGFGGNDEIGVDDSWSARVLAGAGADRVRVWGDDVVVRGQAGRDRIKLLGTAGLDPSGRSGDRQQVAFGGRGPDVMVGTTGHGDRLVGGPGKDSANGRKGRRDYCSAEVTKRCERP